MKKSVFTFILFFLILLHSAFNQSFHVNNIFNPGLTIGTDYPLSASLNDTSDFQLIRYKIQLVKPVRTRYGVALEDFDVKDPNAKASQMFVATKFSVAHPSITNSHYDNVYKGELEFTAITASNKNGIWVYSANLYAEESSTSFHKNFMPNIKVYTAFVNIQHLKFVYFYGATILVNQGRFYPLPLFGFRAILSQRLKLEFLIPVHIKLNYELTEKLNLDLAGYFSGINAIKREGSALQKNDNTLNLRELKIYLALNTKLAEHYKLKVEFGYASMRKIHRLTTDFKQDLTSAPYISFSLNYNFGNSVFGNFIDRTE
ncbi:MAG: hypothetical protein K0B10_02350 [Vicingaceae bacterium]|nr:hypothetical protein [Vicingaceae bacterium]